MEVSLTVKNPTNSLESYHDLCMQGALALGYSENAVHEYFAP